MANKCSYCGSTKKLIKDQFIICENCKNLPKLNTANYFISRYGVTQWLEKHQMATKLFTDKLVSQLTDIADSIITTYNHKAKILVCGAGGSLHDHLVSELMNRFTPARELPIAAIDLSGNTCLLSAITNDYGYEYVFSKQIISLGNKEDLLIAISTSGKTPAVLNAIAAAQLKNMKTILITGIVNHPLKAAGVEVNPDFHLQLPSTETGIIQELWLMTIHAVCHYIEQL